MVVFAPERPVIAFNDAFNGRQQWAGVWALPLLTLIICTLPFSDHSAFLGNPPVCLTGIKFTVPWGQTWGLPKELSCLRFIKNERDEHVECKGVLLLVSTHGWEHQRLTALEKRRGLIIFGLVCGFVWVIFVENKKSIGLGLLCLFPVTGTGERCTGSE